jgi:hypothetical protein
MFPTPKKSLNLFNKSKSFSCKAIWNTGVTLQLVFKFLSLKIEIKKLPSASVKPVANQGLRVGKKFCFSTKLFLSFC